MKPGNLIMTIEVLIPAKSVTALKDKRGRSGLASLFSEEPFCMSTAG